MTKLAVGNVLGFTQGQLVGIYFFSGATMFCINVLVLYNNILFVPSVRMY